MTIETEAPSLQKTRRRLMTDASLGALAFGAMAALPASPAAAATALTDPDILNFALNLEYLEAEYYMRGVTGSGLPASMTGGVGTTGIVTGGRRVSFDRPALQGSLEEIMTDEVTHVAFLRSALDRLAIAEPTIDFTTAFSALGKAAGLEDDFDPFADELSFLLGAFVFEDVGVTAYSGAAPAITSKAYLAAAAGILSVEAYHAGELRLMLYQNGMAAATAKIAAARAAVSGTGPGFKTPADDQGVTSNGQVYGPVNIVPTDTNSLAFARTPAQVLSVVYLGGTTGGGFFPDGVHGAITTA